MPLSLDPHTSFIQRKHPLNALYISQVLEGHPRKHHK